MNVERVTHALRLCDLFTYLIVCFEVFQCEIHCVVTWQINMSPFYRFQKWGWGELFTGMDGDGDDVETSHRDRDGDGDQSSEVGRGWV